jgi:SNF2-related domain/SNF2 Helicase protein/Helicase conserved C-terminal domain
LSLPSTSTARRAPLELAFVPRGVEDPVLGFYSFSPLTPGGWTALLEEVGLPDTLRRLQQAVVIGGRRRSVEMRCLASLPGLAYLLTDRNGASSASVRAWRLAARVVEAAVLGGGTVPDLSRFAAAFPEAGHAVVDDGADPEGEPVALTPEKAVAGFVDSSMHALAAAVRDPKLLRSGEVQGPGVDLSVLQPLLRAVAPDLGLAAPVVRLRDSLAPLQLRLELPAGDGGWALRATPPDAELLRRAAHVFAPLARSVDGAVTLTEDGVLELRLATSALEFAGARVELPPEVAEERDLDFDDARLELAGGPLRLDGVVHYDLKASLGGHEVSLEELKALAAATQPLVRLGGEWRALNPKALSRARALAASALHSPGMPAMTALGAALAGSTDMRGVVMGVVEAGDGELAALAAQLRDPALRRPLEPDAAFAGELRPYQKAGLGWLVRMRRLGLGTLLADDMGLGKTVQLIAYLLDRGDDDLRPALIVCPTSVLGNWQRELHRFAPGLRTLIHHGPDRTAHAPDLEGWDVVLTSYALLPRDRRMLAALEWRAFALDEAQAVKNPLTRAAQTARAITASHRIALTGTPVENRLDDLWSIMHILNPGLLGTRTGFRRLFATPVERRSDNRAEEALRRMTGPFVLRRRKTDPAVLPDLPPRQDSTEFCTLTVEQAALYQATIDAMLGRVRGLSGIERRGNVLALITRLKQVCNHPAHALGRHGGLTGRSGKLDRVTEMLAEVVAEGDSALVFTQYAVMGKLLEEHLERELTGELLYLDGSTSRPARERIVDAFQAPGDDPRVLVMSLRAGGLGLNLTNASHVFHFDRWWNPAVEDQASDRAHRIGQTRIVQVHRLVCAGTIEERIDQLIAGKRDLATRIVDRGVETALADLGDDELEQLVALGE